MGGHDRCSAMEEGGTAVISLPSGIFPSHGWPPAAPRTEAMLAGVLHSLLPYSFRPQRSRGSRRSRAVDQRVNDNFLVVRQSLCFLWMLVGHLPPSAASPAAQQLLLMRLSRITVQRFESEWHASTAGVQG